MSDSHQTVTYVKHSTRTKKKSRHIFFLLVLMWAAEFWRYLSSLRYNETRCTRRYIWKKNSTANVQKSSVPLSSIMFKRRQTRLPQMSSNMWQLTSEQSRWSSAYFYISGWTFPLKSDLRREQANCPPAQGRSDLQEKEQPAKHFRLEGEYKRLLRYILIYKLSECSSYIQAYTSTLRA